MEDNQSNLMGKLRLHILNHFWKFISFCFVGGTAALIYMLIFNFFLWINFSFVWSWSFAALFSIIYNFTMNRNMTFKAKNGSVKKHIFRWVIVYSISIGVNFLVSVSINHLLGGGVFQSNLAAFTGIIVSIPIGFLGSLFWVFKDEDI